MDNVIADHTLHKRWRGIVTVDALGVIYVPLRPVLHASCAAIACRSLRGRVSWLQNAAVVGIDRKSTRLNSSHGYISYAVFCLKKKKKHTHIHVVLLLELLHTQISC